MVTEITHYVPFRKQTHNKYIFAENNLRLKTESAKRLTVKNMYKL